MEDFIKRIPKYFLINSVCFLAGVLLTILYFRIGISLMGIWYLRGVIFSLPIMLVASLVGTYILYDKLVGDRCLGSKPHDDIKYSKLAIKDLPKKIFTIIVYSLGSWPLGLFAGGTVLIFAFKRMTGIEKNYEQRMRDNYKLRHERFQRNKVPDHESKVD